MTSARAEQRYLRYISVTICLIAAPVAFAQFNTMTAGQAPAIHVNGYTIEVTLDPARHSVHAQTTVNFTVLRPTRSVLFELNPALNVSDIADAMGKHLEAQRVSSDATTSQPQTDEVQVTAIAPLAAGQNVEWTFAYSGVFQPPAKKNGDTLSQSSMTFAAVGDPVSYLLYAARWFPVVDYGINRFTASIHVHVPPGEQVFGSGLIGPPEPDGRGDNVFDFEWRQPAFPGTIIAGTFSTTHATAAGKDLSISLLHATSLTPDAAQNLGQKVATIGEQELGGLTSQFGPLPFNRLSIVELPAGTIPAVAAPGIVAVADPYLRGTDSYRLLANTIAHQWWGEEVSPAARSDSWITNGLCRYAELERVKATSSASAFADAIFNVSASALAYGTLPMKDIGGYGEHSPQFQAMTYDKGAMIFRMLQWQIGNPSFQKTLHEILTRFGGKSITRDDVAEIAERESGQSLKPFFSQWLDSTGAPTLAAKWTLYRLGDNKGYRILGEVDEDLDLFQMPVDLRVQTNKKTISRRIEIAGPATPFQIDTDAMPTAVALDPDRRLLRNSPDMQVRVHILRGMEMVSQGNSSTAIREYKQALAIDRLSSLSSYRLGEVYFAERNYQAAEGAFRAALNGDGAPNWIEVWSDVQLGKIFDASGQRNRAVTKYREALQTGNNTGGAIDLARKYLQQPYAAPK